MTINEQRVREFAYQIWESEGKPHGHSHRHWEMACKLAHSKPDRDIGSNAQETASTEPLQPLNPDEPQRSTEPQQPISPSEPAEPINPEQPFQPEQPLDPVAIQPAKKSRAKAAKNPPATSLIDNQPLDDKTIEIQTKVKKSAKKAKAAEKEWV